jgi:predicted CXXCH cytochrome family protein
VFPIRATVSLILSAAAAAPAAGQASSVVNGPHNLSTSGPGMLRATSEEQVCLFCHAPHNASMVQPLWNRYMPVNAYTVYSSTALDALPAQPTGSSKMCLSCHDGTIAVGSVVSRNQTIRMASGATILPAGDTNLGTDLSDDHPISFRFDSSLVGKDPKLANPHALPAQIALDVNGELQCTSCHDPHDNSFGDFLVMGNSNSALCRSCHQLHSTTIPSHSDCRSCHKTHTAPSGPFLLVEDTVTTTCLSCHDGSYPDAEDIASSLRRMSVHDTDRPIDPVDPIPEHVTCSDCHEPHTMSTGTAPAVGVSPTFGRASGVSAAGGHMPSANFEYEVCYKCHAEENVFKRSWVSRRIMQVNTRLEFDLGGVSYHPVQGPGRNPDVVSLKPPLTGSSQIRCTDCHGSDTSRMAGGSGPNGVHGSGEAPLLLARYSTADFTAESTSAYALCYRCHYRDGATGILSDVSFEHSVHVQDSLTPCSVCHDPHGINSAQGTVRNNSSLINFDSTVVFPDPTTGRLEYESTGRFSGRCFLSCHGVVHSPTEYAK